MNKWQCNAIFWALISFWSLNCAYYWFTVAIFGHFCLETPAAFFALATVILFQFQDFFKVFIRSKLFWKVLNYKSLTFECHCRHFFQIHLLFWTKILRKWSLCDCVIPIVHMLMLFIQQIFHTCRNQENGRLIMGSNTGSHFCTKMVRTSCYFSIMFNFRLYIWLGSTRFSGTS